MTDRIFNTYSLLARNAIFLVTALVLAIFSHKAA